MNYGEDPPFPWKFTLLCLVALAAASAAAWMLYFDPRQKLLAKLERSEASAAFYLDELGRQEVRLLRLEKELRHVSERRDAERRALEECIHRENHAPRQ